MNTLPPNAIATGSLRHRRYLPQVHEFEYPLRMTLADVSILPTLFPDRGLRVVRFRAADYYQASSGSGNESLQHSNPNSSALPGTDGNGVNPSRSLKQQIIAKVQSELSRPCGNTVFILTQLRQWGCCFNPVSFYFIWDEDGALDAIVAEITNTPWEERHQYVIDAQHCKVAAGVYELAFDKCFHVSPFVPMDIKYRWRFLFRDDGLSVFMALHRGRQRCFDALLTLRYDRFSYSAMRRQAWLHPFCCQRVLAAIYWQALCLWWKRTPFFRHPKHDVEKNTSG